MYFRNTLGDGLEWHNISAVNRLSLFPIYPFNPATWQGIPVKRTFLPSSKSFFISGRIPSIFLVVDNTSNPEVIEYLRNLEINDKIKFVENNYSQDFAHCIAQGLDICNPKSDILILNNDRILTTFPSKVSKKVFMRLINVEWWFFINQYLAEQKACLYMFFLPNKAIKVI
jgi:hypothetical protein